MDEQNIPVSKKSGPALVSIKSDLVGNNNVRSAIYKPPGKKTTLYELPAYCVKNSSRPNNRAQYRSWKKRSRVSARVFVACCVCIFLFLFICAALNVYTVLHSQSTEHRVQEIEDTILAWDENGRNQELPSEADPVDLIRSKRKSGKRKNKRGRKRRHGRRTVFVHLLGTKRTPSTSDYIFRWDKEELNHGLQGLTLEPSMESGFITKIGIAMRGVYLVYSQVAINGAQNPGAGTDCAQETVRIRANQEEILLKSLTTQENLGQPWGSSATTGQPRRALDTNPQMGVFFFLPGDEVFVRVPVNCHQRLFVTDHEHSYFGIVKLGT